MRYTDYEITKILPARVNREISKLTGNDYKITPLRDSLKLECSESAARLIRNFKHLDSKDLVVGLRERW